MKSIYKKVGTILFWCTWPLQWLNLHLHPERTRVLIVACGEALLIRPFMGPAIWLLPGGGLKHKETAEACAVREVKEEVGVDLMETELMPLGKRSFVLRGLPYKSINYAVEMSEKPNVHTRWYEVYSYSWVPLADIDSIDIAKEVKQSVKRFIPSKQEALL